MRIFGVNLLGGLCNMLFPVAAGEWLAHKYGMDVVYYNARDWFNALPNVESWTSHAEEYKAIFKNFDWFKNQDRQGEIIKIIKTPFAFKEIIPEHGCGYAGYFQSHKYFNPKFIRDVLTPSDAVAARLQNYDCLWDMKTSSIHIRRGNYLRLTEHHPVQDMGYYAPAIGIMKCMGVKRFVVFSNDIGWCREAFVGEEFVFIQDTDYIEMFLMMRCDNSIISNSSFSCFPALLAPPEERCVVYPANWFTNNKPNASDICPPQWIKI
jgi:hypothetical protein